MKVRKYLVNLFVDLGIFSDFCKLSVFQFVWLRKQTKNILLRFEEPAIVCVCAVVEGDGGI